MTSTIPPTVTKLAVTAVTKLAVTTVGQLNPLIRIVPADNSRFQHSLKFIHCNTPPAVCTTLLFEGAVAKHFYFLFKDQVSVVTCPTQATNSSNLVACLSNLGDQLDEYCPVSFFPREFGGYVITLVNKGTEAKYWLPTSVSNPLMMTPPTQCQPGDARLHRNTKSWSLRLTSLALQQF
jgi:hypothetical protein